MADEEKIIDVNLRFKAEKGSNASKSTKQLESDLKAVETQANRTREKMSKLMDVGAKAAMAGAVVMAPFMLAMNKYVAASQAAAQAGKAVEPTAKKIAELSERWEASQVRLGKVTADIVLPALEKGMEVLDGLIAFAEENPGVVKAALTIGTTLVVLGGIIASTAQLAATVATIQGLAASAGFASVGGGAAAAGVGAGGVAAIAAGVGSAITAAIPALVAALGAGLGLFIVNAINGTDYTLKDLLNVGKLLLVSFGELIDQTLAMIGVTTHFSEATGKALGMTEEELSRFDDAVRQEQAANRQQAQANTQAQVNAVTQGAAVQAQATISLGQSFANGWASLVAAIKGLFGGGRAEGGYVGSGFYRVGERGREYVLNTHTTKAAESLIGGSLTQSRVMGMMTNNIQLGSGMTIRQARRIVSQNNLALLSAIEGAL